MVVIRIRKSWTKDRVRHFICAMDHIQCSVCDISTNHRIDRHADPGRRSRRECPSCRSGHACRHLHPPRAGPCNGMVLYWPINGAIDCTSQKCES